MSTRFIPRVVAVILAALVGLVGIAASAHAEQRKLTLSFSSAGPFADNLDGPLFTGTYVPGSVSSTFYVKNDSSQQARVTLSLTDKTNANALEQAISFTARAGGFTSQTPVPLHVDKKKNQCRTIVNGPTVNGGGVQAIEVTMHIDPDLSESAMNQTASFGFVVTLSQVTNKGKVDACGEQPPGGTAQSVRLVGAQATGDTSTSAAPQEVAAPRSDAFVAAIASAFLAAGALLLLVVRRRRRPSLGQ